ncbi:MAG: DKNYY domain-containing protein [Saprospiraceae bacterium]|nr:DKNYY domain-containing protein [Saprospiraceae bacterium]MBK8820782.1 DKNYY domain-containing protein [Saprospiraceae bacterium]MBK9043563.1 DKNYY domain-containing protein [Saprospiraceae bacterium]MBP6693653.1 DKNYY domain-containing protein [Saprospiraceae bacterium]
MPSNTIIFLSVLVTLGFLFFVFSCKSKNGNRRVEVLPYGFSIVADTIRFYDSVLENVDVHSFEILDEYFCKDKNKVFYYRTYRRGQDYFSSKKHSIQQLHGVDAATFVSLDYGYGKDRLSAWHKAISFEVSDIQSLNVLDFQFVKDKNHVYIDCRKVPKVLGQSFERINTFYAKDAQHFYYIHSDEVQCALKNIPCDYHSYELLDYTYSKDNKNVFYNGEKIKNSNSESFLILSAPFSKDRQNVYYESTIIQYADPQTFKLYPENELSLGDMYYAKDKSNVFANNQIFHNIDKTSFKILNEKYCMDKNGVYYRMKNVKGAHAATFNVFPHQVGDADAKDHKNRFFEGEIAPQ